MSEQETPPTSKGVSKRKAPAASNESTPSKGSTSSAEATKYQDALVYLIATNPSLKFNFGAMAEAHGKRTLSSWEHQFRPLRAKAKVIIDDFGQDKWNAILGVKGTPPKRGKKRKLEVDAADGNGALSVPATPSKKGPVKKKGIAQIKKKTKHQSDDEDGEDGEEGPKTPKPATKRRARKAVKVEAEDLRSIGEEALIGEEPLVSDDEDVSGFAAEIA